MPFTRQELADLKGVIKESIREMLNDDSFISALSVKIEEKTGIDDMKERLMKLESENQNLRQRMQSMEQYSRRNSVRIIGLEEGKDAEGDLMEEVKTMFRSKMNLTFEDVAFSSCFRAGRKTEEAKIKPRHVVVSFHKQDSKMLIMKNRRKLKDSGILIVEDLISDKHKLLKKCQEIFGAKSTWTLNGTVHVRYNKIKYKITTSTDIDVIIDGKTTKNIVV